MSEVYIPVPFLVAPDKCRMIRLATTEREICISYHSAIVPAIKSIVIISYKNTHLLQEYKLNISTVKKKYFMFTCIFKLHILYKQVFLWSALASIYLCKCIQTKRRSFGFKTNSPGTDVSLLFFVILEKNILSIFIYIIILWASDRKSG